MNVVSQIASDDQYHYGFNGQMKTNEWAGVGNHNTALFGELDTRIARRLNLDPKSTTWASPYSVFENSPIWHFDFLLDSPVNPPALPLPAATSSATDSKYITPKFTLRYENTYGPSANGSTSIFNFTGNKEYYNSGMFRDDGSWAPDEPNNSFEAQYRLGEGHTQVSVGGYKQKFRDEANGVGIEAPSATYVGLSRDNKLFKMGKIIETNYNAGLGVGPELGNPRSSNSNLTPSSSSYNLAGYSCTGAGASVIIRVDARIVSGYLKYSSISLAMKIHYAYLSDQMTTQGTTIKGNSISSVGFSGGASFKIGR
jgi:hypothetical protein